MQLELLREIEMMHEKVGNVKVAQHAVELQVGQMAALREVGHETGEAACGRGVASAIAALYWSGLQRHAKITLVAVKSRVVIVKASSNRSSSNRSTRYRRRW